jgi:hypothetical protein
METANDSPVVRVRRAYNPKGKTSPKAQKSRITNGSSLLPGIDGRSAWVRRCKDLIGAHLSDLPNASVAERSLVRRAAVLTTQLERLERRFAIADLADEAASADDLDVYIRGSDRLQSLLSAIGLARRSYDMGHLIDGAGKPEVFSPLRSALKAERDTVIDVPPAPDGLDG